MQKYNGLILLLLLGLLGAQSADSTQLPKPRTALMLSLLLPGAGQVYNRSAWKAPIIWAALGTTGYLTVRNHQAYLLYRTAYQESLRDPSRFTLPPENLRRLREYYRQNRDIFLLVTLVLYGLNAGDAYVEAHLKGFTIYAGSGPNGVALTLAW